MGLQGGQADIYIAEFLLIQTGTYQEQYLRPFEVHAGAEHINALGQATNGGQMLDMTSIEKVASSIIHPQRATEGVSHIPNGWTSRRFSFIMRVVEVPRIANGTQIERIFYGYTDHSDASRNHLDPDMRIYFNSEMTISTTNRPNPQGMMIPVSRVMSATQIISPMDMAGPNNFMGFNGNSIYLVRPEDTFYHAHDVSVTSALTQHGAIPGEVGQIFDGRTISSNGNPFKMTRRQDNSASRYLKRTLDGFGDAFSETLMENDGSIDQDTLLIKAGNNVKNQELHMIDFFNIIKEDCGYLEQGFVRYQDLCHCFSDLDRISNFSLDDGRSIRNMSHTGQSATWNGGEDYNIAPAMLAQVVPSVMMENFIRQISFTVTPGHGVGEYIVDVDKNRLRMLSDNLPDDVVMRSVSEFIRRLKVDALNYITQNNQIYCSIGMMTNLQGESVIDIEIGSEPLTRYVAPTFSDGLFTPMATRELDRRSKVCNDVNWLMSQTFDRGSMPQPSFDTQPAQTFGNSVGHRQQPQQPQYPQQQDQNSPSFDQLTSYL